MIKKIYFNAALKFTDYWLKKTKIEFDKYCIKDSDLMQEEIKLLEEIKIKNSPKELLLSKKTLLKFYKDCVYQSLEIYVW